MPVFSRVCGWRGCDCGQKKYFRAGARGKLSMPLCGGYGCVAVRCFVPSTRAFGIVQCFFVPVHGCCRCAAVRCSVPSMRAFGIVQCFFVPVHGCCRCAAVRCSVPSMRALRCSVFYAFMRAVPLRRDAAQHGGGNGFLLRSFQGSRRFCLFGFLLICSNFKKSPNSAVSLGSNRIHFPSRYVCALS